ncbi:transcriptional regulator, MarR family [Acinetobacter radioresistens SH164]|jgi:DNA-binding MarR family transcriptional regulator|nr:transcriptional regulator, MarR family [Acinetobacter radioresistens SH164]
MIRKKIFHNFVYNEFTFFQRYGFVMLSQLEQFLPNKDPNSLKNFPFFWISQINGKYTQLIEKSIKKLGIDNTRRKIILSVNAVSEASITEIANLSTIKLTTATKAVYRLVEDDIVEVFSSQLDERVSMVKLTEKGQQMVEQINQISQVTLAGILHAFEEDELHDLNKQLKKLFDLMPSN